MNCLSRIHLWSLGALLISQNSYIRTGAYRLGYGAMNIYAHVLKAPDRKASMALGTY